MTKKVEEKVEIKPITEVTIADVTYPLSFGLDFISEMDKRYQVKNTFGMGVQSALFYLEQGNPVILRDIILSATHTLKSIPSRRDIEDWLAEQELDGLFQAFLINLKTAPFTRGTATKFYESAEMGQ